jgi:hypothetical protein
MSEHHTREPWKQSHLDWRGYPSEHHRYVTGDYCETSVDTDEDGNDVEGGPSSVAVCRVEGNATSQSVTEANARRIVACVNACESVSTDNLHPGDMHNLILDLDAMRHQRDALLAACKEALAAVDEAYQATGFVKVAKTSAQRQRIEAAIDAAESG